MKPQTLRHAFAVQGASAPVQPREGAQAQRRGLLAALAGLAVTAGRPGVARADAGATREAVVVRLRSIVSDAQFPLTGVSVAWLHDDGRTERAWAGWRRIGADHPAASLPIEGQTLYRIASVSKLALALATLRLHEARLLDLDADLSGWLGQPLRHPRHAQLPISARLLLSHRSGLLDPPGLPLPLPDGEALRRVLASPASWGEAAPGRHFRYSNLGFMVLATAMESAARLPFDALMQHWLFEPLGLTPRYHPAALSPAQREQLATLYRRPDRSAVWLPQADDPGQPGVATRPLAASAYTAIGENASVHSPQGGLRIGVPDLTRLTALLMHGGRLEGRRLLSADGFEQLIRPLWRDGAGSGDTADGLFRAWTLGLQHFTDAHDAQGGDRLRARGGVRAWGHLGQAYGLLSGLLFQPRAAGERAWGLVYVINGSSQAAAETPGRHSSLSRPEEAVIESLLDALLT